VTFVFLHVGDNPVYPAILVRSLRRQNKGALIVQCTDAKTKEVKGVDGVLRQDADSGLTALFRMQAFASVQLTGPAMFLDTDMVCVRPIDPAAILGGSDVALCARSYSLSSMVRPRGYIELPEYRDRTYGDVYPFLGCATIVKDSEFWLDCAARLKQMPDKFHKWFGDQDVLRDAARSGRYSVKKLPESIYASLPDKGERDPAILHYKGAKRKWPMLDYALNVGLITEKEHLLYDAN
jgi:hypothetical protein